MSLTKASFSMITGAPANVFDFMSAADIAAVQAGGSFASLPDVTASIQAAIDSSQVVYFPHGQYKITSPIKWSNQWLIGAVDNGDLSLSAIQTMILADGTHPAFQYYNSGGYTSQGGGIRNFNIFFADGLQPPLPTTRPNAIGFYVASTGGYPAFHTIENITVRGAMWAVFDQSGSWMGTYKHINSQHNYAGFFKNGGTTHSFENCYHAGGKCGFNIINCLGVDIRASAVDLVETNVPGYRPIYVEKSQVVFSGCDFEGNIVNADQTQVVLANGEQALLRFDNCAFLGSVINAATETYLFKSQNGAQITISNVDCIPTDFNGTGGLFAYLVATTFGRIVADTVLMPVLSGTGTPTTVYATLPTGGGSSIVLNNCITPYQFYARSYVVQRAIEFSTTYTFPTISSLAYQSASFTVVGAKTGDLAFAELQVGSTEGLIITAHVNAVDTVTVTITNMRTTSVSLPLAVIDIRVVAH